MNIAAAKQKLAALYAEANRIIEALEQSAKAEKRLYRANSFMARMSPYADIIRHMRRQGYSQAQVANHLCRRFINTTSNLQLVTQVDISRFERESAAFHG